MKVLVCTAGQGCRVDDDIYNPPLPPPTLPRESFQAPTV